MNLWGIIKGLLIQDESDRSKELSLEISPAAATATRTTLSAAQTADRTLALPDTSGVLVEKATTDALDVRLTTAEADIDQAEADIDALEVRMGTAETNITANAAAISAHVSNPTAAHAASAISNTPAGNLAATDVQGALNELQTDVDTRALASALTAHTSQATGAHAASAISVAPVGNLTSVNVQAALVQLQSEIDTLAPGGGANTFLSNLTAPTAINQALNPGSNNSLNVGTSSVQWLNVNSLRHQSTFAGTGEGSVSFGLVTGLIADNTGTQVPGMGIVGLNSTYPLFLTTANDPTANATATGSIKIMTGPKTAGTGASGSITLQTGTSAGGTRGKVKIQDGTQGTVGHVLTQTAVDGTVGFQAVPTYVLPNNSAISAVIDYSTSVGTGQVSVPNATVTIVSTGRPVMIMLIGDNGNSTSGSPAQVGCQNGSSNICFVSFNCQRNASFAVGSLGLQISGPVSTSGIGKAVPASSICYIDPAPPVGSNTYTLTMNGRLGTHTAYINASRLYVREL